MTSEVCLMNRKAAILAADSAVTLSYWHNGKAVERYHQGANKIFQLSRQHPIGLMIYDSAEICSVPWEVLAKEFRKKHGQKSKKSVKEYAKSFFEFLEQEQNFIPLHIRARAVLSAAENASMNLLNLVETNSSGDARGEFDQLIHKKQDENAKTPFHDLIDESSVNLAIESHLSQVQMRIVDLLHQLDYLEKNPWFQDAQLRALSNWALERVLKDPKKWLYSAGLVFAGFGVDDVFPSFVEYSCCEFVGSRFIAIAENESSISHLQPASMQGFAQSSMIETFHLGISRDTFFHFSETAENGFREFAESIASKSGGDLTRIVDLDELVTLQRRKMTSEIIDQARKDHGAPFRRVLGSLSIEEMCELAETLINLQSLKEKVTQPSASVGGPIDIAAITKGEGLIWVKRKHYFTSELNPLYHKRVAYEGESKDDQEN